MFHPHHFANPFPLANPQYPSQSSGHNQYFSTIDHDLITSTYRGVSFRRAIGWRITSAAENENYWRSTLFLIRFACNYRFALYANYVIVF